MHVSLVKGFWVIFFRTHIHAKRVKRKVKDKEDKEDREIIWGKIRQRSYVERKRHKEKVGKS